MDERTIEALASGEPDPHLFPAWVRAPDLDKRLMWDDHFSGDAWRHKVTGAVRYTCPNVDANETDEFLETR